MSTDGWYRLDWTMEIAPSTSGMGVFMQMNLGSTQLLAGCPCLDELAGDA